MSPRDVLAGELRQAIENWMGETVGGPWDDIVETLAKVVDEGSVSVVAAARLDQKLRETTEAGRHDECPVCDCPLQGMHHG